MTDTLTLGTKMRTVPIARQQPKPKLYRFFVNIEGEVSETLAIVSAPTDDVAMQRGFRAIRGHVEEHIRRKWGFDETSENDEHAPFFSCETLTDTLSTCGTIKESIAELKGRLSDIPAFKALGSKALDAVALGLLSHLTNED